MSLSFLPFFLLCPQKAKEFDRTPSHPPILPFKKDRVSQFIHFISLSLSLCLYVSLSLCLSLSLSLSVFLCILLLCLSFSFLSFSDLFLCLSVSAWIFSLSPSLLVSSVCFYVSLSLCFSISVCFFCLSLSLCTYMSFKLIVLFNPFLVRQRQKWGRAGGDHEEPPNGGREAVVPQQAKVLRLVHHGRRRQGDPIRDFGLCSGVFF